MSQLAVGNVLALPVAAAGTVVVAGAAVAAAAALAAVAVAGAGVVVVREGGRAVIGCGRELTAMADENLKMQRALNMSAARYEAQLRQQQVEQVAQQTEAIKAKLVAIREAQAKREARLARIQARLNTTVVEPTVDWDAIEHLRADLLAASRPPATPQRERLSGWCKKVERAQDLTTQLAAVLASYRSGANQGLYQTAFLEELLHQVQEKLEALDDQADAVMDGEELESVESLDQVMVELSYLDHRLEEMRVQLPQRRSQRQEALATIERARVALDRAFAKVQNGAQVAGLNVATQALDDALHAIEQYEFTAARAAAEAVLKHVEKLEGAVALQRTRNLNVLLERLKSQVEPLRNLTVLESDVEAWLFEMAHCERLIERDLDAAWAEINRERDGLAAQAEQLHAKAVAELVQQGSESLAALAEETLHDMGYTAGEKESFAGGVQLIAREGARRIFVTLSHSGQMALKLEGFGDDSCQVALDDFLARLKAKGVSGAWQKQFTLSEALQRLVSTLQQAGLNVEIEPSHNGATVLASGKTASINYDGELLMSEELQELCRSATYSLEDPVAQWEDKQRDHARHLDAMRGREYNR